MEATPPTHIRLLAIDIDGTLLDPDGKITPATRSAVQAAQQAGIVVTLATARRYCNTAPLADKLAIECPIIICDGAMIIQHPHPKLIHSHLLPAEIAQQAVEIMVRHGVQPVVHPFLGLKEEIWTGPQELDNLLIKAYFETFPEQTKRMPYKDLCTGHLDPQRVVAFASEEEIASLVPEISALDCFWTTIKRGSYGCAEMVVMHSGCSKASGVAALARSLNIAMEEVMAIGDNNNDIPMLQSVGWGVAMGHASDAVKAVANAVTTSNREDGVARAIERYALRAPLQADSNSFNRATWR